MKITKEQIQKIIKEELEALEETYETGTGAGYDQLQDSHFALIDAFYRKKYSGEQLPGEYMMSDTEEREAKKYYKQHQKQIQAARKSSNQQYSDIGYLIKVIPTLAADEGGNLDAGFGPRLMDKLERFTKNYLNGKRPALHNREKNITISDVRALLNAISKGQNNYYRYADKNDEFARNKDNFDEYLKDASGQIRKLIRNLGERDRALAKIAGGMEQGVSQSGGEKQGFGSRIKSFFGLEENLTLTAEELDRIIDEEIQNVTKGN